MYRPPRAPSVIDQICGGGTENCAEHLQRFGTLRIAAAQARLGHVLRLERLTTTWSSAHSDS